MTAAPASFWHRCITIDYHSRRTTALRHSLKISRLVIGLDSYQRPAIEVRRTKWKVSQSHWIYLTHPSLSQEKRSVLQRAVMADLCPGKHIQPLKYSATAETVAKYYILVIPASESPAEVWRVRKYLRLCVCLSA